MRGRTSHRGAAPTTSAAAASTSSKRDPEDEPASASEESGDEEVKPRPSLFFPKPLPRESGEPSDSSGSDSDSDGLAKRERELERVLADVPFGELQRARADGSLAARGGSAAAAAQKKARRESRKRFDSTPCWLLPTVSQIRGSDVRADVLMVCEQAHGDKHKCASAEVEGGDPGSQEVSGKDTISYLTRNSLQKKRYALYLCLCNPSYDESYRCLYLTELNVSVQKLQKSMKKLKDPNAIEEVKSQITWIDKQLRSNPQKNVESEIVRGHIKKEREAAKAGKQPYYLKKSEIRQRKLMDKYNELKETGKLDAFIEKRRKKNASKDHRYMPYRRDGGGA
ncbi:hypothetical protein ACQ4PT_069145 [Festuca glaucescens]